MNAETVALARIRARVRAAERKADEARDRARAIPAYLEWEQKRDTLRFQIARCKAMNVDCGHLNAELEDAKAQLNIVMAEHGITESDFTPTYECPVCNDVGYVMGAPCACLKDEIFRVMQENGGAIATDEFRLETLEGGLPDGEARQRYSKFYRLLADYAHKFPDVPRYLVIAGAPSTGKTYALCVLANALMRRGHSALVLSAYRLNQTFLEYHLAPLERKQEVLQPLLDVDFLFIDDLGVEPKLQNVTLPYLLMLQELRSRPTAITTNLNAEQLRDTYGERIAMRFLSVDNGKAILLSGYDFRLKRQD